MSVKEGDMVRIIHMDGEPQYTDKTGIVTHIDDAGQIWINDCGCAVIPGIDRFEVIRNE